MCEICRRTFIRRAFAFGAASASALLSTPVRAQPQVGGGSQLPARGEFTIANAYVMTMDGALGDIAAGSVHVRNGEIIAVGSDVSGGGERIDGTDMIVMPGLVDTHWHMWNTLFRSFAGDKPEDGYFPTVARFGAQMTPGDVFQSTRLSAAEAINSGMTFMHSWCHNVRSAAYAEAELVEESQPSRKRDVARLLRCTVGGRFGSSSTVATRRRRRSVCVQQRKESTSSGSPAACSSIASVLAACRLRNSRARKRTFLLARPHLPAPTAAVIPSARVHWASGPV
jgi:hypothetical protein